ncbi:MAG TPA: hypothetical protein VIY70_00645, partial [Acidimicrobiia bacterium]
MIPVSDNTRRRLGYLVIAAAIAAIPTFVAVSLSIGDTDGFFEQIFLGTAFGTVMVVAMRAAPRSGAVWALAWGAFCGAWGNALETLIVARTGFSFAQIEQGALAVSPASLDLLTSMVLNFGGWLWLGYFLLPIHLVLLFPAGRASSRVWRSAMWLAGAVMTTNAVAVFVSLGPWVETPYDEIFAGSMMPAMSYLNLILLLMVPLSVGNLVVRFRRSSGVERLQFRWLTWAVGVLAVTLLSGIVLEPRIRDPLGLENTVSNVQGVISTLALAGIPISIGIAITRYRLYEIDRIISRTVTYTLVASVIAGVYAIPVVALPRLLGGTNEAGIPQQAPDLVIAGATLAAAAVFN